MTAITAADEPPRAGGAAVRRTASLKTRTVLIIAVLMAAIVGGDDLLDISSEHADRLHQLRFRADLIASIQADALVAPLWNLSQDQIRPILAALDGDPDFLAAEVTDADGKLIATLGATASDSTFIEVRRGIVRVENDRPEVVGRLALRLSTANADAFERRLAHDLIGFAVLLAVIMGAVYAALHLMLSPLARMTEVMTRVAGGDTELAVPGIGRSDEIGAMARAVAVFKRNTTEVQRLSLEQERLQSQVKVQRLRRRFAQALDSSAQAIVLFDAEDRVVACNAPYLDLNKAADGVRPEMETIVGLAYRETVELRLKNGLFILPDGGAAAYLDDRLAHRREGGGERTSQLADGRWMHIVERQTPDGDVVQIWSDVSVIKKAAAQQRALETQLHHAQKIEALGTLAGGIAHDLNNTLVPILGLSKLTMRRLPEDSRERANLATILEASERARDLVRQILTYSRKEEVTRQTVDLAALVRDALKILRASLPATIDLKEEITAVPPISADPGQLHQILMNLVVNAAQAIGESMGTITVALEAAPAKPADGDSGAAAARAVRLAVRDTGCGMDEATKARIFEPFFTTKAVNEGTGLGLSIVHGIIEAHGGTISVASAPGEGTVFTIELPAVEANAAPDRSAPAAAAA
jgi:signal transduction histidine kinase/HAMP domain-containing protein